MGENGEIRMYLCVCCRLQRSVLQACQSKQRWMCICGLEHVQTPDTCWTTCLPDSVWPCRAPTSTAPRHTCSAQVRQKLTIKIPLFLRLLFSLKRLFESFGFRNQSALKEDIRIISYHYINSIISISHLVWSDNTIYSKGFCQIWDIVIT